MSHHFQDICRREFIADLGTLLAPATVLAAPTPSYQIGAYYFPNWHADPRNEAIHGPGWTEWELLKRGEPRFPGHRQPKHPLWGFEDESNPVVFERKIDAAADHALTHFIFDWYWYDGSPFLQRCLEQGYMRARNNRRLRFALMWANHVWVDLFPTKLSFKPPVVYDAVIRRPDFDKLTDYVVSKYFSHPSYWKLDGSPYFSIYELYRLVQNLGGIEPTAAALESFRAKTKAAGFPDLHLNAVTWSIQNLPDEKQVKNAGGLVAALGFNSTTSYVWIHHVEMPKFPVTPYDDVARGSVAYWHRASEQNGLPYHPNVTMGWDPSPRTCQSDRYLNKGYPFTPTLGGNSPAAFQKALESAKRFLESTPRGVPILTLNAWNEWTEGSYLEPDTVHGMKYLQAVRSVFG